MFWFKRKIKSDEPAKVIFPEKQTIKVEDVAHKINVALSKLTHEINELTIKHFMPAEIGIKHVIPEIKIVVEHRGFPTAEKKPTVTGELHLHRKEPVDEAILENKAKKAAEINRILATKGERIRNLRQYCWDKYLEYDRKQNVEQARIMKAKVDTIDQILGGQV